MDMDSKDIKIFGQNCNGNYGEIVVPHYKDSSTFTSSTPDTKTTKEGSISNCMSYEKLPQEYNVLYLLDQILKEDKDKRDYIIQTEFKKNISKYNNKNKVLIHCSLGVSRSASFTVLYFMKKFGLGYDIVTQ